ncbi:MAG: hypothetical protein RIB59_12555 [Rhodospirillales bacterium]
MLFDDYQRRALKTDQKKDIALSVEGLASETGRVLETYQAYDFSGDFPVFKTQMVEELGGVLWYVSSIASIFKIKLSEIASFNVQNSQKAFEKWNPSGKAKRFIGDANKMNDYQRQVVKTDRRKNTRVSVLGLVGESGSIATICKKYYRDEDKLEAYKETAKKELGDALWYVTSIATNMKLKLEKIAEENLRSNDKRWLDKGTPVTDIKYDEDEKFPRKLRVVFKQKKRRGHYQSIMQIKGLNFGDKLTDNAYEDDGYRFHDVIHLSFVAILGWSPVIRKLLNLKRKSSRKTDEVEDGARALIIEEAVAFETYNTARDHNFFSGSKIVPDGLLNSIQKITRDLEVNVCTKKRWQHAILEGYKIFRLLRENGGGVVKLDLDRSAIKYEKIKK